MHSVISRRFAYAAATFGSSLALAGAIALAALAARADGGARGSEPRFPYDIELDESHRFFLFGEEVLGPLRFDYSHGVLSVNARAIDPPPEQPPREPKAHPDSTLRILFGGIPLVRECVARGEPWNDCVRAFSARQDSMVMRVADRWRSLRVSGARDPASASAAEQHAWSDSALALLDAEIVGDLTAARAQSSISAEGLLQFPVPGSAMQMLTVFLDHRSSGRRDFAGPLTREQAFDRVIRCSRFLAHRRPAIYIISRGGDVGATGENAAQILQEIAAVQADPNLTPKRLSGGQAYEFRAFVSR
ncbi:MAG: hypothetical protein ACKVU1_16790 [bacterium]